MNIAQEKINLIQQISLLDDEDLIDVLKNLVSFGIRKQKVVDTDFWLELNDIQKKRIENAIQSLNEGIRLPHNEVMAGFRKRFEA